MAAAMCRLAGVDLGDENWNAMLTTALHTNYDVRRNDLNQSTTTYCDRDLQRRQSFDHDHVDQHHDDAVNCCCCLQLTPRPSCGSLINVTKRTLPIPLPLPPPPPVVSCRDFALPDSDGVVSTPSPPPPLRRRPRHARTTVL